MDLGGNIRHYRKLRGLDQKTLAEQLNVSNKTISSWESNRTQPKMEMIEELCKVFQCQKSDFLEPIRPDVFIETPAGPVLIEAITPRENAKMYGASSISIIEKIDNFIRQQPQFIGAAVKLTPEQINMVTAIMEEFARLNKEVGHGED